MCSIDFYRAAIPARSSFTLHLASLGRRIVRSVDRWQARRQALRQLCSVNVRTLKDIGLDRTDVTSAIRGGGKGRRRSHDAD